MCYDNVFGKWFMCIESGGCLYIDFTIYKPY
jgi:hypothetical protein